MTRYLVLIILMLTLGSSLTADNYNDMPWTQAMIHFKQIVDSVKHSSRDIWGFEIKIIEDIKTEIKNWCKQGRIRVLHRPDGVNDENMLGISTKNYVITIPKNPDEEKYLWTLPAVQCRAKDIEESTDTVALTNKDKNPEDTNTRSTRYVEARDHPTNTQERDHGEYDSSSSSEEDDETLAYSKKEKEMVSSLEKQLLENNRNKAFDIEEDNPSVYEGDSEKVKILKKEEKERFIALEVLVVGSKGTSTKNEESKDLSHLNKRDGGHTADKHLVAIEEWKRETHRLESSPSNQGGNRHIVEEMGQDKIDKINKGKKDHDQALAVANIKRTEDQIEAQRRYVEENVRQTTIETMKRDKDHIRSDKSGYVKETVEEASSSESSGNQQPTRPDNEEKELFSAKLSRHLTFRKKVKKPTTN